MHGEALETLKIVRAADLILELPDLRHVSQAGRLSPLPDFWKDFFCESESLRNSFIKSTLGLLVVLEIFHLLQTLFGCGFRFVGAT